jgi:glycogen debranching enzyme
MPDEIIQIEDQYYILATSTRPDDRPRVIKEGESFAVFDHGGSIRPVGRGEQGIFHEGTRFLSRFELGVHGRRLQPLRSNVRSDHVLEVALTNPDFLDLPEPLTRNLLYVQATSFLLHGTWYARFSFHNYALRAIELEATFRFAADYVDIFEVRGRKRERRGRMREPVVEPAAIVLGYDGLDAVTRMTRIELAPQPKYVTSSVATFALRLPPHEAQVLEVTIACLVQPAGARVAGGVERTSFATALARNQEMLEELNGGARLEASNHRIDEWIQRSHDDVVMMTSNTEDGPYPYAGVPWYSTVFGRDGLITAFQRLWVDPALARGVLVHLAALQATEHDPVRDAEPGKIVHELRRGEMAALHEIPFGRYYGSVDATPLFVMLLGWYWRRTADRELVARLWPNVERALAWIEHHGDHDGDGFVDYQRRSTAGLVSQGWKDSTDPISHRDGRLAEGPIALCEVQAYVYGALRAACVMAGELGHVEQCRELERRADLLRDRFEATFWSDELGTYVLALDGGRRPCMVRASNAGHTLFAGIASPEHARRVADALMGPHSFTGWGIRTLDEREVRYNPLSYHNGSVWPHDNAMIALGMARYGLKDHALELFSAMYRAAVEFDLQRMPELFCGFPRGAHESPVPYPVACAPQAWAAGAVFMLLQACLGVDIEAPRRRIRLVRPVLPDNLDRVTIRGLRVLDAWVDLVVQRQGRHVGVYVDRSEGDIEVIAVQRSS